MGILIPKATVDTLRMFSDITVGLYGIACTLFVPNNITALEPNDAYTASADYTYDRHNDQTVWIEWYSKNLPRLRKLGIFSENEIPIVARFKAYPEVKLGSYIKIESRYVPDKYDTDEFEVADVILQNMYDSEIYRWFKMVPRRAKS